MKQIGIEVEIKVYDEFDWQNRIQREMTIKIPESMLKYVPELNLIQSILDECLTELETRKAGEQTNE